MNSPSDDSDDKDDAILLTEEGSLPASSPTRKAPPACGLSGLSSPNKNPIVNDFSRKDDPYIDEEVVGPDGSTVYGQLLRGTGRKRVIEEHAAVSLETKKKRRKEEEGLADDTLSNDQMISTNRVTQQEDLAIRKDKRANLPGIFRSLTFIGSSPFSLEMHLWTQSSVVLYKDLACRENKLIVNVDITEDPLIGVPLVDNVSENMLFHTIMTVDPKYVLLPQGYQKSQTILKNISPIDIAERISTVNTADTYFRLFWEFMRDVISQSNASTDDERRQLYPLLCLTGCSPELESGALGGFTPDGCLQRERLHYSNIVLCYLLWFDHERRQKHFTSKKDLALSIVERMRTHGGVSIFLKQRKSHVYRAPERWLAKQSKKIPKLATFRQQFGGILKAAFRTFTEEREISVVIVSFSVLVAFFQTERFVVESNAYFGASSEVQSQGSDTEIDKETKHFDVISEFIKEESSKIQFKSVEDAEKVVQDHETIRTQHISLHQTAGIIERAKKLLQKNCCTFYLHGKSVDGQTFGQLGTLRTSYVLGWKMNRTTEQREMWKEGGIDLSVSLPFDGKRGVRNPLHSPEMVDYLIQTWLAKPALWSHGIIDVLNDAFDLDIDDNNQLKEDSGVRRQLDIEGAAEYMRHRYDQVEERNKLYVEQCGELLADD